ncbi:MAG: PIG-L family deacetylase [Ferruginibacter sp.]
MPRKILTLLFFFYASASYAQKQKTILFLGAHPDDETAIGEVLSKYARLGNKVIIMIATDGRDGTRVTKIPAGDSLGNLRKKESACGCEKLGIEPPVFLSIERLDTKIGVGKYFKCHKQLMDSLKMKIPAINPDIIITTGPDGDTHHSEHIVVGGAITELLLAEGWVDKYPLYYIAWGRGATDIDDLGYVDKQYFNVQVDYTQEEENRAIEALKCYVTQYTEKEMKDESDKKLADTSHSVYFRRFTVQKGLKKDF